MGGGGGGMGATEGALRGPQFKWREIYHEINHLSMHVLFNNLNLTYKKACVPTYTDWYA